MKYHSCGFIIDVSLFSTIKIDVLIHFKIISQIRSSLKIVETPPNEVLLIVCTTIVVAHRSRNKISSFASFKYCPTFSTI